MHRRASELLGKVVPPNWRFEAIAVMATEGLSVQLAAAWGINLASPSERSPDGRAVGRPRRGTVATTDRQTGGVLVTFR